MLENSTLNIIAGQNINLGDINTRRDNINITSNNGDVNLISATIQTGVLAFFGGDIDITAGGTITIDSASTINTMMGFGGVTTIGGGSCSRWYTYYRGRRYYS